MNSAKDRAIFKLGEAYLNLENAREQLEQAKREANDMSKRLRVIADCFDLENEDCSDTKVLRADSDDTFHCSQNRHGAAYGTGRRPDGSETWVYKIPQGLTGVMEGLLKLEEQLKEAKEEFEERRNVVSRTS